MDGRRFLGHHGRRPEKVQRSQAEAFGDGMVGFHLPEGAVASDGDTAKTTKAGDQTAKGKTTRTAKQKAVATA